VSSILTIVEGDGDLAAVPMLVRRILHETLQVYDVQVLRPQKRGEWPRVKREFDRFYQVARLDAAPILWVLDFDCDDCVDVEAESRWARERARELDPAGRLELAFMVKEYESLFLAEQSCVRKSFSSLPADAKFPADPERVRDAKGWISENLPKGVAYKPAVDQARLTAMLDLTRLAERSPSFVRFQNCIKNLLAP
jgi:hypothetical protein